MSNSVNTGATPPVAPPSVNTRKKTTRTATTAGRFNQTLEASQQNTNKLARKKLQSDRTVQKKKDASLAERKRQQRAEGAKKKKDDPDITRNMLRPDPSMRRLIEQPIEAPPKEQKGKSKQGKQGQGKQQQQQHANPQDDAKPTDKRDGSEGRPTSGTVSLASDTDSRSVVDGGEAKPLPFGSMPPRRHTPLGLRLLTRQAWSPTRTEGQRPSTTDRLRIAPQPGQHQAIELNLRDLTPQALATPMRQPDGTVREVAPHQADPMTFGRAVIQFDGDHELSREVIVRYKKGSRGELAELMDLRTSDPNHAQGVLQLRQIKAANDNNGVAVYAPTQAVTVLNPSARTGDQSASPPTTNVISPAFGRSRTETSDSWQSFSNALKMQLANIPKDNDQEDLKAVISKFNNDATDKNLALAKLLTTYKGIQSLKDLTPSGGLSRESHQDIVRALGRIGGTTALDIVLSILTNHKHTHAWRTASGAIKSMAKNNPTMHNDFRMINATMETLGSSLRTLAERDSSDIHQFRAILSSIPAVLNIYGNDFANEQIAKILILCTKIGQSIGDTDKCNLAFRALLEINATISDKYMSDIPPNPAWLSHKKYYSVNPKAVIDNLTTGGNSPSQGFLKNLEISSPATHLQLLIRKNIHSILRAFSPEDISSLITRLFNQPQDSKRTISQLFHLDSIRPYAAVQDMVGSNWATTCECLLTASKDMSPPALSGSARLARELGDRLEMAGILRPTVNSNFFSNLLQQGWEPKGLLGTTLIFHRDGNCKAVRIQKAGELISHLARQHEFAHFLNEKQNELGLQSKLPRPEGLYQIDDLLLLLSRSEQKNHADALLNLIETTEDAGPAGPILAYVYDCEGAGYFTPLHQAESLGSFSQSASAGLHDLIVLLKECDLIFPRLADLSHRKAHAPGDEAAREHYRALMFERSCCSGLRNWKTAVEFAGLRGSGLAEEGDCRPVTDLIDKNGALGRQFFSDMFSERHSGEHAPTLLLANCIAEYMLVVELAAARWAVDRTQGESREDTRETWQELGQTLRALYAQVLSEYADVPREKALDFLDTAINWQRYARQLEFWTTDKDRISVIMRQRIPENVYGPEVQITLDVPDDLIATMLNNYGKWRSDLRAIPDNGKDSGMNPLLEAEKARFIVATFALRLRNDALGHAAKPELHGNKSVSP
ncbi:MAG: hypothetical protein WED00_06865 [Aquisalimonadaceae bacterium]